MGSEIIMESKVTVGNHQFDLADIIAWKNCDRFVWPFVSYQRPKRLCPLLFVLERIDDMRVGAADSFLFVCNLKYCVKTSSSSAAWTRIM